MARDHIRHSIYLVYIMKRWNFSFNASETLKQYLLISFFVQENILKKSSDSISRNKAEHANIKIPFMTFYDNQSLNRFEHKINKMYTKQQPDAIRNENGINRQNIELKISNVHKMSEYTTIIMGEQH